MKMRTISLLSILLAITLALAYFTSSASAAVLSSRNEPREGWVKGGRSDVSTTKTFHIAMKQQNLDVLDKIFWEVSDPDHDNYQNFLSAADVTALTASSAETVSKVKSWLSSHGITEAEMDVQGDNMAVTTTIAKIESAFSVQFYQCSSFDYPNRIVNAAFGLFTVPDDVRPHLDFVTGLSNFPNKNARLGHVNKVGDDFEGDAVLPQTLQNIYGVPSNLPVGTGKTTQGVIEFDGESFSNSDLQTYSAGVGIALNNVSDANIIGPNDPSQPGDESSLDIQVMEGINPTSPGWFWLEQEGNWLYAFTVHFLNTTEVPNVISISYGWYEWQQCEEGIGSQDCSTWNLTDATFVTRVNTQFQKIGTTGVSIFVASGDSGCHTRSDPACQQKYLLADYPASSTYVTSVGATEVNFTGIEYKAYAPVCQDATLNYSCVYNGTEAAVDRNRAYFSSGGGFSNISAPGPYQANAISGYLNSGVTLPPPSYFDAKGRGYPDIGANGHNGYIVMYGQAALIGGTSQASPFAAGIYAELNDYYASITGAPFGFLNPLLYKMWGDNPKTFIDIIYGDNFCPEGTPAPCPQCEGYYAAPGWDPVTGLGTINYPNTKAYLTNLAHKVVARREAKKAQKMAANKFLKV